MPSMLEQAIIDAASLREAALKNAEQAIIEKYAPEIKNAVESMLQEDPSPRGVGSAVKHGGQMARVTVEADNGKIGIQYADSPTTHLVNESELEEVNEEDMLREEEGDMGGVVGSMPAGSDMNIPVGASGGEAMCPCPDDEDTVTFEFSMDDFKDMAQDEEPGPAMPAPSLADIVGGDEEPTPAPMAESKFQEVLDLLDEIADEELKEDQEVLDEELVVDMAGQHKNGTFETNEATLAYQQEMELAKQESTKHKEENEELEKKLEELDEAYNKLSKENELYENTIYKLNQRVKSTLLSNAKLLYTNRALKDASLNERQKTKIAEAIQKARNPEEAKALWETLRTTVGSDSNVKKGPQSLSESVNRRSNLSSMLPRRNNVQSKQEDAFSERMRKLAGIK
jgi:plasmid stabilization system protein ParE